MCGICGFYKLNSHSRIDPNQIAIMNEEMYKRGPDGSGIWMDNENRCGLGHRRLSIIDLSDSAAQPMCNADESVVVTYNGEIYNHMEIREELNKIGEYMWKTDHSDTEVILHAYEQWGIDCIEKFRGMFAFAIWDKKEKRCILVRDRMGIKPLYYMEDDGNLVFSSEIKALLKVRKRSNKINIKAMYDYLSFISSPIEETLIDGIYKVTPSTYLIYENGHMKNKTRYWDVWDHTRSDVAKLQGESLSEIIIDELRTSVNYRRQADVPVGIFLSGGIDSSTNTALFAEGERNKVKTFCIGYNENYKSYKNENYYARKMSDFCHAEYHELLLGENDMFDFLPTMVDLMDEPVADMTSIPSYYVSKLARNEGIVVAQVGEGADELFWGYRRWKAYLHLAILNEKRFPKRIKQQGLRILELLGKGNKDYTELLRRSIEEYPIFWSGAEGFYEYDKQRMVSESVKKELNGYSSFEAIRSTYDRFMEKAWEKSYLNWMSYVDLNHRLPELLLMRVDKMSMANSLECRVPFLDHKFVEMAMSIPQERKTEGDVSKVVLKKAIKGLVPDEMVYRKKQGFTAPVSDWYMGKLGIEISKKIGKFNRETGYFNSKYIEKLMYDKSNAKKMWYLYTLALWYDRFII